MLDSAKLSAWFEAHAAALKLYARQWLDAPEQAEDVVHEAFVALISQRNEPDDARAWLFKVVRNLSVSCVRSTGRRRRREGAIARCELFEQRIDDLIDAKTAEAALRQLPIEQRELVVLRIWGQMRFNEIAELTGSSLSTVFDRYRAALAAVREKLERSSCRTNHK
jgi:RNA polymerase sigma factor (sigma-70 family)